MTANGPTAGASKTDLEQLVAEADFGGRQPSGLPAKAIMLVAVAWSLFQLWYASPLPFLLGKPQADRCAGLQCAGHSLCL